MSLVILCIIGIFISLLSLGILYSMPSAFLKEFEKNCHKSIEKRNKEFEEKEKLNKELKKWIFR